MLRFVHTSFVFLGLCLFLSPANAPAQQPTPALPPIPAVMPPEPPDPDNLPAPPQLEWQSLNPKDEGELAPAEPIDAPAPQAEPSVAPPPPPIVETPLSVSPTAVEIELAKPEVQIWRQESELPQIPVRSSNKLDQAYVTGTEPVWLKAQFDTRAVGKGVHVRPGRGLTVNPPGAVLTVSENGDCVVLAQLAQGVNRSHIIFYCQGIKTVLPVVGASLETVIDAEQQTGGER
jgi:hypothetical protein